MKKYSAIMMMTAVLLGAGMAMTTACIDSIEPEQKDIPQQQEKKPQVLTLTIQAEKVEAPETKGLVIDGSEAATTVMKSVWTAGEVVDVYKGTELICQLTAGTITEEGRKATLTGTIPAEKVSNNDHLTLLTSGSAVQSAISWNYTGQTGILMGDVNSIEKKYNYALATVTATVDGSTVTTSPASFENQRNIYRLSFRFSPDENTAKTHILAKSITITSDNDRLMKQCTVGAADTPSGSDGIAVSLASATTNPVFVALRIAGNNAAQLNFTVVDDGGVTYNGSKEVHENQTQGTFVSFKNATLTRVGAKISTETTQNIL